jgi:Na+-translocating ferredoxin:NAD+ oxidoreductase subunit C
MVKTFERGVFLPHYKKFSEAKPIATLPLPKELVIPLHQHTGAPCSPLVAAGDKLQRGKKSAAVRRLSVPQCIQAWQG